MSAPRATILTIGNELLQGDRTDTNAAWLARSLTRAGFRVVGVFSCGDAEDSIGEALERAESSAGPGVVVVTGGLGPTLDDCTRDAVAAHRGLPLEPHPPTLDALHRWFAARGLTDLPPTNRRIAQVPRGARVHPNPRGTAPGLEIPPGSGVQATLFLLPGVPGEMRALFREAVLPALERDFPKRPPPAVTRVVQTSGVAESRLAALLEGRLAERSAPSTPPIAATASTPTPAFPPATPEVNLQYRPSVRGVELFFSCEGDGAEARLDAVLAGLEDLLHPVAWGGEGDTLEAVVLEALAQRGWHLAMAESCTGGLLGARLTAVPGSSRVVLGGIVAYDDAVKIEALGVAPEVLKAEGAVSAPVARAMARGARRLLPGMASLAGVSITGVAGPGGGSEAKPVGTVWIGWALPASPARPEGGPSGSTWSEERGFRFPGTRDEVRERAVQQALLGLLRMSRGEDPVPDVAGLGGGSRGEKEAHP